MGRAQCCNQRFSLLSVRPSGYLHHDRDGVVSLLTVVPQISLPKLTFNYLLKQRIMSREQKEGGKMVSSIESLNFSVTLENDVEITVKDVADWELNQDSPKVSDLTVSVSWLSYAL